MAEFTVLAGSEEAVQKIIESAYSDEVPNRRAARATVKRILELAKRRGYVKDADFQEYFSMNQGRNPKLTRKILRSLFEYVSQDEIMQLSRLKLFDD